MRTKNRQLKIIKYINICRYKFSTELEAMKFEDEAAVKASEQTALTHPRGHPSH